MHTLDLERERSGFPSEGNILILPTGQQHAGKAASAVRRCQAWGLGRPRF